jgi:hypothetical protein
MRTEDDNQPVESPQIDGNLTAPSKEAWNSLSLEEKNE